MKNLKVKNLFGLIGAAVVSTVILTLPMRSALDHYQSSEEVEIIYTPINQ